MTVARKVLIDFAFWSSAAGLLHVGRAKTRCVGAFWLVIWIVCFVLFVIQMWNIIVHYLAYNVMVKTELLFKPMRFPAVTICSQNSYKASKIEEYDELEELMQMYSAAANGTLDPSQDKYGLLRAEHSMDRVERARDVLHYLVARYPENTLDHISYQITDLIEQCSFGHGLCTPDNFTPIYDPVYGRCFTFKTSMVSQRAGPSYGLRLFLKSNTSENLIITDTSGIRVTVTSPDEPIFPDSMGSNAKSGFTTSFALRYMETTRLPLPYSNCTRIKENQTYSQEACLRECVQENVVKQCGCQDAQSTYFSTVNASYCDYTKLDCVTAANTADRRTFNIGKCDCHAPCQESTYAKAVSTSTWPSKAYLEMLCATAPPGVDCHKQVENSLIIELYYEQLNYLTHDERPAYPFELMISDMGGDVGLWLGISFISLVEFTILPSMLIWAMTTRITAPDSVPITYKEERVHNTFDRIGGGSKEAERWAEESNRQGFFRTTYYHESPQYYYKPNVY